MRIPLRRPSPALVISCVALTIALGGTSYATVLAVPKNSVGTDQLKNGAVKNKKIADNALCPMCHLGGFSGQNEVPRVAGQQYDYVVKQLQDFRDRRRTNDAGNMAAYTRGLTDEEIDALAQYAASLN